MKKIILGLLSLITLLGLGILLIIWLKSPGKPIPIQGKDGAALPNSISVIEKISVGDIDQYLVIRGQDANKPVLLMLHGGPGTPEFPLMRDPNLILEKAFVVVHWEQRGAGKSYTEDIPVESMTTHQLIEDAAVVSRHLQKRFNKEKIYLMGHSWGSFLGILTAHRYPNLFHSYIGIGQVASQYEAERLSLEWVKQQAAMQQDEAGMETLSTLSFPDSLATNQIWLDYLNVQRGFVNQYGGGMSHIPENATMFDVYMQYIFGTPEYTIADKLNILKAATFSGKNLWDDVIQTDLNYQIDSLELPVHILQGKYDYQTTYAPAKAFFDQLKAPKKAFYTFDHSAHTPFLDEIEKFNQIIMEKVLIN